MAVEFVDEDVVAVHAGPSRSTRRIVTLLFGDAIQVGATEDGWTEVTVHGYFDGPFQGFVKGSPRVRAQGVLKLSVVDVQQGDGMILESPGGKILFVDGGDNQLFARHAAACYRHRRTSAEAPLEVDAIVVTHGDADHFAGLTDLRRSEDLGGSRKHKRLFLHPKRVFHNGLVKKPGKVGGVTVKERDAFGATVVQGGDTLILDLYDDPRDAPEELRNRPFRDWCETLDHWEARGAIDVRRLAHGMDAAALFGFLGEEGIGVEIQGPFERSVPHPVTGELVPALPFLHEPRPSSTLHVDSGAASAALSAAHTINGHSIALRVTYGEVRIALTGDLNREAMAAMAARIGPEDLEAEVVKAPHHGSHDFDFSALARMRPVVTIVSSGDENAAKEYIHPRATLMAALGKVGRGDTGLVFCTELAAFFTTRDYCHSRAALAAYFRERKDESFTGEDLRKLFSGDPGLDPVPSFYGFERTNFGIVHVRTDGERVLVLTHSGREHLNEAYRFHVARVGEERRTGFRRSLETR